MKKQILALSIMAALSGCDIDNSGALKVGATFDNEYKTEVGFFGSAGKGFDVELTTGHGAASGTLTVADVNYGEANVDYNLIGVATDPERENARTLETSYGTFTIAYTGEGYSEWTYDLNEELDSVIAILDNPDATLTDTVTIPTLDGSTQKLNFIIKGVDPTLEAEFDGAFLANVSLKESAGFGTALVYDPNFDESSFVMSDAEDAQPKYGTITIQPDGKWIYELIKPFHADIKDLTIPEDPTVEPESVSESFFVYSKDGSKQEFKVNITGAPLNYAPLTPSATDIKSEFAINFKKAGVTSADIENGKLVFSVKITDDLAKTANISMSCDRWNSGDNRRLATFYIEPDGEFRMYSAEIIPGGSYRNGIADYAKNANNQYIKDDVVFDQALVPGEWAEITMTWQKASPQPKLTLKFNGEPVTSPHGAIPTDPDEPIVAQSVTTSSGIMGCLSQMRVYVNKDETNGGQGGVLIDDIKYFTNIDADVKFDTPTFADGFDNSEPGDPAKDADGAGRYSDVTTDNVLIVRDI